MSANNPNVKWQCMYCGHLTYTKKGQRPPFDKCSKNKGKPHRWIKMREL